MTTRRDVLFGAGAMIVTGAARTLTAQGTTTMYGLIGRMQAQPGQREELARILIDGVSGMPGCLSYVVAADSEDADALWITEVWDDAESHARSLELPSVQQAIAAGRPLIAGFSDRHETRPLGGHGLD